jgi:signal transduction histidine kinase
MRARLMKWLPAAGPLLLLTALAGIDRWAHGPAPFAGVVSGMALLGLLAAVSSRTTVRIQPAAHAVQAALRSVAEGTLGVVLVFLLAAPLTVLLPEAWVARLLLTDRATDLWVLMLLGVALWLAGRAMQRAARLAADRAAAERDAAHTRAELAEREHQLTRAELQTLRAQIEPHFLWNTLANIEYLVRRDAPRAQAMLAHLIAYLRAGVPAEGQAAATLGSEFESLRAYVGLMQCRMGERLRTELSLAPDCADVEFAPHLLQTLVENAIKHGLEPKPGEARLSVTARRDPQSAGQIVIEVIDNGAGLQIAPATRGTGLGLRNVRERLRAMQGPHASLTLHSNSYGGVTARINWTEGRETPCEHQP